MNDEYQPEIPDYQREEMERFQKIAWDFRPQGRAWGPEEVSARRDLAPEKSGELIEGKLYWSDAERLTLIGLLIENVGVDAVVRMGESKVWKEAVAKLS